MNNLHVIETILQAYKLIRTCIESLDLDYKDRCNLESAATLLALILKHHSLTINLHKSECL